MSNWFETTNGILTTVWSTLEFGVADAKHPARRPTLATVSPDGWPEARTVVLRSADRDAAGLTVHTDLYSDKIKSLRATPRAALHIWDAEKNLQVRVQAEISIISGAQTRALWNKIPDHAQQSYGVTPPPGTAIEDALAYDKDPDPETFAVLQCAIAAIDVVHLGDDHRRVSFSRTSHWQGQWLSP